MHQGDTDTLPLPKRLMMEGYFVRTLGMHRVYNSAFMNMLKREDNAKYRATIKNTIESDPEIQAVRNLMNNPDEETAVTQFGKGDKYFGVCTMMVAMPDSHVLGTDRSKASRKNTEWSTARRIETKRRTKIC